MGTLERNGSSIETSKVPDVLKMSRITNKEEIPTSLDPECPEAIQEIVRASV